MTTPRTEAGKALDDLWMLLWDDLRHNATGKPTGDAIIARYRPAIEAQATENADAIALDLMKEAQDRNGRLLAQERQIAVLREAIIEALNATSAHPGEAPAHVLILQAALSDTTQAGRKP